jgi:hypothetical protein
MNIADLLNPDEGTSQSHDDDTTLAAPDENDESRAGSSSVRVVDSPLTTADADSISTAPRELRAKPTNDFPNTNTQGPISRTYDLNVRPERIREYSYMNPVRTRD